MKILITGGAGFLGYHLCQNFASKYDEVILFDTAEVKLEEYPKNTRFIRGDVRDDEALSTAFKGCDEVVHAASALPLSRPQEIFDVNVEGTRQVLKAAKETEIQSLVYISSTAVYGVPKKHPIEENDALVGVGPYGKSKIMAEEVCLEYRKKGMCVPIVRPKTFIGNGRLGVFQILYDWIKCGKKVPVIGNGNNRYQLLEVDDLTKLIDSILKSDKKEKNDTFNIGAERFSTVKEDVGKLCEYAKTGARVMTTPGGLVKGVLSLFEKLGLSPLYQWVYETADRDSFVSIQKAQDCFGWKPAYSNAEALIRSYQWYEQNYQKASETGITHRKAWKQGVLSFFKKIL